MATAARFTRTARLIAEVSIHPAAGPDPQHEHDQGLIVDLVDHAVATDTDTAPAWRACERHRTHLSRITIEVAPLSHRRLDLLTPARAGRSAPPRRPARRPSDPRRPRPPPDCAARPAAPEPPRHGRAGSTQCAHRRTPPGSPSRRAVRASVTLISGMPPVLYKTARCLMALPDRSRSGVERVGVARCVGRLAASGSRQRSVRCCVMDCRAAQSRPARQRV